VSFPPGAVAITLPGPSLPVCRTLRSTMPDSSSDDALAQAFAAHERWAFEEAYRQYAALLYSAAYNVVMQNEEAQDCVHDALARVWRSPHAYSATRGNLRSFLTVCVRNEAISRQRRQGRKLRLEERLAAQPVEYDELPSVDPIERDRLRSALKQLPDDQRVPLELAYYAGHTHREIAAELKQPLGTVKSRIASGLRKLGSVLQPAAAPLRRNP
jgi:RNA polymerase sigma factor (sigma-70 family)